MRSTLFAATCCSNIGVNGIVIVFSLPGREQRDGDPVDRQQQRDDAEEAPAPSGWGGASASDVAAAWAGAEAASGCGARSGRASGMAHCRRGRPARYTPGMREIRPGLYRWTARHRDWRPNVRRPRAAATGVSTHRSRDAVVERYGAAPLARRAARGRRAQADPVRRADETVLRLPDRARWCAATG